MHPSPSSVRHPALPSDGLLHWEVSFTSPLCCVRIVYPCICKALWGCWPSAVDPLESHIYTYFLSFTHMWSALSSSDHTLTSPTPTGYSPPHTSLCTTTLQKPSCSNDYSIEPQPFISPCIAPSSLNLFLLSSPPHPRPLCLWIICSWNFWSHSLFQLSRKQASQHA